MKKYLQQILCVLCLFALPASVLQAQTCEYKLVMDDLFGDGWNGASLTITVDAVSNTHSLPSGLPDTVHIAVTAGATIQLGYVSGSYDDEVSFTLYDSGNLPIFSAGPFPPAGTNIYSTTAVCPTCPAVDTNSITVTNITQNSATVNWASGGNAGSYMVKYGPVGTALQSGIEVATAATSVNLTGLSGNISYEVYVVRNCSTSNSLSSPAGPTSFLTLPVAPPMTLSGFKFNTGCLPNSGEIDLKVLPVGVYSYQWSNNKTTQDIKNLVAGAYTVTVTNTAGATQTASFGIASAAIAPEPQYVRGLPSCNPTAITLKWEGPTTGSFEVRYRLNTATTYTSIGNVGNVESYTISGLQSNKTYLFQVRHVCVDGTTKSAYKGVTKKTSNCFGGGASLVQNFVQTPSTGLLTAGPNPANNYIRLVYTDEFSSNINVVVADLTGRVVFQRTAQWHEGNTNWQLPTSEWPTGIYQAIVKSPSGSAHISFVVQR